MNTPSLRITLSVVAVAIVSCTIESALACDAGCLPRPCAVVSYPPVVSIPPTNEPKLSWVFRRSTFTNDPETGARVGQFARIEPVEPLDDQRLVTSSYRRMRSELRGRDGSMDTTYVVQGWGTGGGEMGAQWQMFNDVWKEAILSGSFFNGEQAFGPWGNQPWGGGNPNWNGWGPGWGGGWPNQGWPGGGGWNGGGWNGGGWNGGGWNGGGWGPGNGWNRRRGNDGHWPSDNRRPLGGPNEPPANF
jgi:hypothetical protein